jgi:hypothetical protein
VAPDRVILLPTRLEKSFFSGVDYRFGSWFFGDSCGATIEESPKMISAGVGLGTLSDHFGKKRDVGQQQA